MDPQEEKPTPPLFVLINYTKNKKGLSPACSLLWIVLRKLSFETLKCNAAQPMMACVMNWWPLGTHGRWLWTTARQEAAIWLRSMIRKPTKSLLVLCKVQVCAKSGADLLYCSKRYTSLNIKHIKHVKYTNHTFTNVCFEGDTWIADQSLYTSL